VTLASSGERWPVPPHKTIAQVLGERRRRPPLLRDGDLRRLPDAGYRGVVDHRDTVQSEAEKSAGAQQIALCCSRSRSANLCIDL
jgi:vanillate O-demethylase ferredoxin subunit